MEIKENSMKQVNVIIQKAARSGKIEFKYSRSQAVKFEEINIIYFKIQAAK